MSLNRVELTGGLTRDGNLRYTQGGMAVCEFTVAVNGTRYDPAERRQVVTTVFVTVDVLGWLAERITDGEGLVQGDEVYVLGELDQYERETADGKKDRKTRVRAIRVEVTRRRSAARAPSAGAEDDPWA